MFRTATLVLVLICMATANSSLRSAAATSPASRQAASNELFSKQELRESLTFMEKVEERGASLGIIQAVNLLLPLGKEKALFLLEEYDRNQAGRNRRRNCGGFAYYVPLVLFDVPKESDCLPYPPLGMMSPQPPDDRRTMPRFPIIIVDDIPIQISSACFYSGPEPSLRSYLKWYHANGTVRSSLLRPTDNPMVLLEKIRPQLNSICGVRGSSFISADAVLTSIANQLANLIDTAYGFGPHGCRMAIVPGFDVDDQWTKLCKIVSETGIRWDVKCQCYVRGDGFIRVAEPGSKWRIQEWRPKADTSPDLTISFERQRPKEIDVTVHWCESPSAPTPVEIEFATAVVPQKVLSALQAPYAERPPVEPPKWGLITRGCGDGPERFHWSHMPLNAGEALVITLKQGDKIVQTATFTP